MNIIITYEGFINEWTGETLQNCILHHGNLNPKDDFIFGWEYWNEICKSYINLGYKNIRAIITENNYNNFSFLDINNKIFLMYYKPLDCDLIINF